MAQFPEGRIGEFSLDELLGTRCRLQRLSDLKFFAGWVRFILGEQVGVQLKSDALISETDRFNLEASIQMANVSLSCVHAGREGRMLRLNITSEPTFSKPGQEARYHAESVSVSLKVAGKVLESETVDISESGIGVWTQVAMPRFSQVQVIVRQGSITVECAGTVRYCRLDPDHDGIYRSGIHLEFGDVLSRAMWQRLALSTNRCALKVA